MIAAFFEAIVDAGDERSMWALKEAAWNGGHALHERAAVRLEPSSAEWREHGIERHLAQMREELRNVRAPSLEADVVTFGPRRTNREVITPNALRRLEAAAASLRTSADGRLVLLADQVEHIAAQVRVIAEEARRG